ncbi:hypothetical protein C9374_008377 [Naegleria lovaniensis]|uniref:Prolyl 4-hydroxylase alpha subunit domain-containing protein n=1 Tax=Naegleria lovaniensis TaxID=51637 RepID=A0AA88GF47_NAELO|nr:uncharacterized protein C9374_008377 [Naegleria lovaniensis]KAG2378234.1 hypothetical protein C9374_008377 [Naegleria lovaniensis]
MSSITIQEIEPGNIWLLDSVFSREECEQLIKESEQMGFVEATFNATMAKDLRNNSRVIVDCKKYSDLLWDRLKHVIPQHAKDLCAKVVPSQMTQGYEAIGFNERIRFYKYSAGQYFVPHTDGCFSRQPYMVTLKDKNTQQVENYECKETSFLTVLLYLNDVQSGGETNFFKNSNASQITHSVTPKAGQVLIFVHWNCHEGATLSDPNEFKYVMRTDAMYRRMIRK